MSQVCSIFSQLLKLFPRAEFEQAVRQHRGGAPRPRLHLLGTVRRHAVCQLGRAQSLREICGGLAAQPRQAAASGLVRRSAALDAGLRQPATPLADLRNRLSAAAGEVPRRGAGPQVPFQKQAAESGRQRHRPVRLAVRLAQFRRTKGAVKLHLVLDHDGYLPSFCVVTDGKTPDLAPARQMLFDPGTIVVFDRGYNDYDWFAELSERGVFFVHAIEARGRLRGSRTAPVAAPPRRRAPRRSDLLSLAGRQRAPRWCSAASNITTPSSSVRWCF